jgi:hypothetical protein
LILCALLILGEPSSMARAYSDDLRKKVLEARVDGKGTMLDFA